MVRDYSHPGQALVYPYGIGLFDCKYAGSQLILTSPKGVYAVTECGDNIHDYFAKLIEPGQLLCPIQK